MTFTIGTVFIEFVATGVVGLIAGFLIGANWYKRKGNGTVIGTLDAEKKAQIEAIRAKALAEIRKIKEQAKENI